ncbi:MULTISPECIES: flagellar basal-body MS-ring/collar protein FliF [Catenuloplanes]|uniref:Flagellar M-ring protein n=1 Tax=Catenuloplanes niger TaxID=587534 RepID=A0AAE3ZS70_9ACTN|nr:flagellar basal-body MS-ring/collar protein FliF [Catenuloplanes niger]MDR7324024.1 flagellar M-ring protein FliF [Catenuloplanes niger]
MKNRLPAPVRRLTDSFASFTTGQKAVTIFAVLALAIGGYFFATWASKPSYAMLFNNLSGEDASAIVENLTAEGVTYELADGGATIMVPKDQVYDLRIQMSGQGLPANSDSGYALLDKQGITTSEFMQHVGYQRALEGELNKTIGSIDGVQAATVHLAIPQKDVFSDDAEKPTASVLIAAQGNTPLSNQQVQSVVHLVASSVDGLDPTAVTVADSSGKVLSAGDGTTVGAGSGDGDQKTAAFQTQMNNKIQAMLDKVLGPGNSTVTTTADLDFDNTETKTTKYSFDPTVPALSESNSRETYANGGNTAAGVLGPDNIQVPNGNANGANGSYESTTSTKNNAVNKTEEVRKAAGGALKKLNMGVIINSAAAGGMDPAEVEKLVASAAGIDTTRGDTLAVSAVPFDTSAADAASASLTQATNAEKQATYLSLAKTGAVVLILLILVFVAWRAGRKARRQRLTEEELARLAAEEEAERARRASMSTQVEIERANDQHAEDRAMRQKEIERMVDDQPDEVAQMLRGWMSERR